MVRVCGATGDVVHGLCFELASGERLGCFLENSNEPMDLADESGLLRRNGKWEELQSGEAIVRVWGVSSRIGFLCGEVSLQLSSGRILRFLGGNPQACGNESFDHSLSELLEGDGGSGAGGIGCVHFSDGTFLCAELADDVQADGSSSTAASSNKQGDGFKGALSSGIHAECKEDVDAEEGRNDEFIYPHDLISVCSEHHKFTLDVSLANEPPSHESWATRVRLCRLDGESRGPVSTRHVVAILSDGCGKRMDITKASVAQAAGPAEGVASPSANSLRTPTTVLEACPLDGECPANEPVEYCRPLALFSSEHIREWPCTVDLVDDARAAGGGERIEAGPKWRLAFAERAMAASLDKKTRERG